MAGSYIHMLVLVGYSYLPEIVRSQIQSKSAEWVAAFLLLLTLLTARIPLRKSVEIRADSEMFKGSNNKWSLNITVVNVGSVPVAVRQKGWVWFDGYKWQNKVSFTVSPDSEDSDVGLWFARPDGHSSETSKENLLPKIWCIYIKDVTNKTYRLYPNGHLFGFPKLAYVRIKARLLKLSAK